MCRSLLTHTYVISATSHHKTPQYQSQMSVTASSSSDMEINVSSSSDSASRTRVEYRPAEAERMVWRTGGGMRPSSAVLAHSLAAKSMAFLEKHQCLSASIVEKDESFRDAGGGEGNRGGVRGDSVLFQDDFLNRNPILMEYMAQAAMEGLELEDDAAGPAHSRWQDEEEGGGGDAAEDEIKFIDVQQAQGENSKADKHGERQESEQQNWVEEEEEEACLSRSETSRRPGSRARCCAGFASNLRQLTSTMTGACSVLAGRAAARARSFLLLSLFCCGIRHRRIPTIHTQSRHVSSSSSYRRIPTIHTQSRHVSSSSSYRRIPTIHTQSRHVSSSSSYRRIPTIHTQSRHVSSSSSYRRIPTIHTQSQLHTH